MSYLKYLLALVFMSAALAGCGGEEETCGVNSFGVELCGAKAATYCDVINGTESDDSDTASFCNELAKEYEVGDDEADMDVINDYLSEE